MVTILLMIPEKCKNREVAKTPVLNCWCNYACGNTGGKMCGPWCSIVEKYGLWTLIITIGVPVAILILILRNHL